MATLSFDLTADSEYVGNLHFDLTADSQYVGPETTTAIVSSLNPSVFGDSVDFTATVTGGGETPTGAVEFFDGVTSLGTVALVAGVAVLTTSALTAGSHTIRAVYGGDDNYLGSEDSLTQVVGLVSTTTTLTALPNPGCFGADITLTATVSASEGTATGTVSFYDGVTLLGTASLSSGVAVLVVTTLSLGTHALSAVYEGDATHDGSEGTATLTIVDCGFNPDCPATEIAECPTPIEFPMSGLDAAVELPVLGLDERLPETPVLTEPCEPCDERGAALKLAVTPQGRRLAVGDTLQLTATVYQDGKSFVPSKGLEYCSSDSDVLTVGAHSGLVTAIAAGNATVSVTWHELYARDDIVVEQ